MITPSSLRTAQRDDSGFAMILVVALGVIIAMLVAVSVATTAKVLNASVRHQNYEGALAAAEAGIDTELSKVQQFKNGTPSLDYVTAAPCNATSTPAASVFATADSERNWAKSVILGLPTSCLRTTSAGQYMAFRLAGRNTVYSMGWAPTKVSALGRPRLLKAEFIFAPYQPGNAILTAGALDFGGSVDITKGINVTGANVHTNGTITMPASVNIQGNVSAVGTAGCGSGVTGTCTSAAPVQPVPDANPRSVYNAYNATTAQASGWYDLCPDGWARYPSTSGPCQGTQVIPAGWVSASPPGSAPGGWTFTAGTSTKAPVWSLSGVSSPGATVYYVFGSNASVVNPNPSGPYPYTILVEGVASSDPWVSSYAGSAICGTVGGDFEAKQVSLLPSPTLAGLGIMATGQVALQTQTTIGADGNGAMVLAGHNLTTQA
ncbi:MAG: hypothetical protein WAN48_16035, partial [Actinomycetes bacterium]